MVAQSEKKFRSLDARSAVSSRREWGGRDSEQLSRALHEIHYAFITAHFKKSDGRYIEHSFNIFPEILLERREFASDPIEACTITLAEPIIASLQDEHFTCLNHGLIGGSRHDRASTLHPFVLPLRQSP